MTGADIIGELARAYGPLVAIVPADRIKGGRLPEGVALPALLVRTISSVERATLTPGVTVRTADRVSATVRARSYAEQVMVMDLTTDACADRIGSYAGAHGVSVLSAGRGPDVAGPGNSFEQAQDFRVSFDKPTKRGE